MEIINLDYSTGEVFILEKDSSLEAEEFLLQNGFNLGDCEWMEAEKIKINKKP